MNAPDVIDLLLEQHARIEELFQEVITTAGEEQRENFHRLVRMLSVHETAEEMLVHPLARRSVDQGDAVIEARLEEERAAKEILVELDRRGVGDPEFLTLLAALRSAVLAHATHEERYEFTRLREANSRATLLALVPAVRAAEALAPTRPHPGVESATMNTLVGPLAAITDRIRDVIRDEMAKADAHAALRG